MMKKRAFATLAFLILAVGLSACSSPAPVADSGGGDIASPTVEEPTPEAVVEAPKSLTWESACMLSVDEVAAVMQAYGWTAAAAPESVAVNAGDTACNYGESNPDSSRSVGIDFRPYGTPATYGWISPSSAVPSFTAPDPVAAAANACATATAAAGSAGYAGICTTAGAVPIVVGANRTSAVAFPEGDFFYVVQIFGIPGADEQKDQLLSLATLVSTRQLVTP